VWERCENGLWCWNDGIVTWVVWDGLARLGGPLTEVLPEPAAPTAADLQAARDQTRADAEQILRITVPKAGWYQVSGNLGNPLAATPPQMIHLTDEDLADNDRKPDGEVPEAGRAGEAQTKSFIESLRMPDLTDEERAAFVAEANPQDRTEGLDAAIEAARQARHIHATTTWGHKEPDGQLSGGWDCTCGRFGGGIHASAMDHFMEIAVRAASPLIERAALHAVADDWENDPFPDIADEVKWIYVEALRDRATRTETS
jgi:hypothetical protein